MPDLQYEAEIISPDGQPPNAYVIPDDINELPTIRCSADECSGRGTLSKCGRCKSAYYCSSECQKKHWKQHKEACNLSLTLLQGDNATEPPLRRHLRHWTARFECSLICAAIVGMDIRHSFPNVHKYGMIVRLHPRPHAITGARFTLKKCDIVSMEALRQFSAVFGMDLVLNQHERERELMKKKSGGQKDFAACVVVVVNEGKWKLSGEHNTEVRFKPLCIIKDMAKSPQLNNPSLAWLQTLEMQIQEDIPARSLS